MARRPRPQTAAQAVAPRIEAILPDPASRTVHLSLFAESLSYVDETRPGCWLTHLLPDRIRLLANRHVVFTLHGDRAWLPLDPDGDTAAVARGGSWTWDDSSYPAYKRPPSRNGYYRPAVDDGADWSRIRELHFRYLDRLLACSRANDRRSNERHEPAVVDYLSEQLQRSIPWARSARLAEEIPLDERYREGSAQRVLVNRYERDSRARDAFLRRYGHECVACGISFADRYGPEVAGLIHVHHLVPLSTVGKDYSPDPARDLVPVCPNCHAVVHSGSRTRSIDEVKAMLKRSRTRKPPE